MKKYSVELTESQISDMWGILSQYQYEIEQELDQVKKGEFADESYVMNLEFRWSHVNEMMKILHQKALKIEGEPLDFEA